MTDTTELALQRHQRDAAPDFGLFAPVTPTVPAAPPLDAECRKARATDPTTAHDAAAKVKPTSARGKLLAAHRLFPNGLTDREAAWHAGLSLASEYATRCSELVRLGLLRSTEETRPDPDTKQARIVRVITGRGLVALDYHTTNREHRP